MTIDISLKFRNLIHFFTFFVLLPSGFVQAHLKPTPDTYMVRFDKGSEWDSKKSFKKQKNIGEHISYWKKAYHDNKIAVGGVFKDSQLAFYIIKESDKSKAQSLVNADPLIKLKVLKAQLEKTVVTMKEKAAGSDDHDHGHSH